jgi:hypothetical protein
VANRLVQKVQPPALPIPKESPLKQYLDDLNNILRLFFNLVANAVNNVFGEFGGRFLDVPNALYFSTVDQALVASNTAQPVTFNQTYLQSGFVLNGGTNSEITAVYGGVYSFQLTLTLTSTSGSSKDAYVWIARNGTDLGYTTRPYNISGSGRMLDIQWAFDIDVAAGEYLEFYWSGTSTSLELGASAAVTPHPGIPSAVITVNFISALPEVRPTPP